MEKSKTLRDHLIDFIVGYLFGVFIVATVVGTFEIMSMLFS